MSFNETVSADRTAIGFFGRRNAGKSSLINAVTAQELSVVSPIAGTTTDPVRKAMELLPLGPVTLIDTAGMDDSGELGQLRVEKTRQVLRQTDLAVLVVSCEEGMTGEDRELEAEIRRRQIPYLIAFNKCDMVQENVRETAQENVLYVSAATGQGVHELKEKMARLIRDPNLGKRPVGDLLERGDLVVLVTPIDASAPKGRMILPQQMVIRDVLDSGAVNIVTKETELEQVLQKIPKPRMVITDSQAFGFVKKAVSEQTPLTSFSILMARYKGTLLQQVEGAEALDCLQDGDTVLISEGCTHHRQCEDIGTVKMPAWIEAYTGKKLNYLFTSGGQFPDDLSAIRLVVHCGGCMLKEKEMIYRMRSCLDAGVPFTNYGVAIARINGILSRSLEPLKGRY